MHCIEGPQADFRGEGPLPATGAGRAARRLALAGLIGLAALGGCTLNSPFPPDTPRPMPQEPARPAPGGGVGGGVGAAPDRPAPAERPQDRPAPPGMAGGSGGAAAGGAAPRLPAPERARSWNEYKRQAAERLVAANPKGTYMGVPPEPLLAIPVLEVELNFDGTVRRIEVLRKPGQALDTVQIAIDAVHRAAPFGPVSHLPRPWKFAEVFLFDGDRRFKPRTLD